jgi:MraZ protein
MFFGQFYHNIDDKGRLTIPARFRELLAAEGAYIMRGFDQNLMVLPAATFEWISHRVNQMSLTDPEARLLRRLVFATASQIEFDKTGRILLPQFLRQSTLQDNSAVVVGAGKFFEIWSPDHWSGQDEQLQDESIAHRFADLMLTSE